MRCRLVHRRRKAFTLVEILVVIGVIGLLVGLLLPTISTIRENSRSNLCLNNLRQIFIATDTWRQQNKDMLPYAAPLPVPPGEAAIVPALPELLQAIVPHDAETWMCPADDTQDSQDLGTSYLYVAGAFMLFEPPLLPTPPDPPLSMQANVERVSRLITTRFTQGYLRHVPLLSDSGDYHDSGSRMPWNAVFIDGNARVGLPEDNDIATPGEP